MRSWASSVRLDQKRSPEVIRGRRQARGDAGRTAHEVRVENGRPRYVLRWTRPVFTTAPALRQPAANRRQPPAYPLISSYRTLIVEFANNHRLLSMFPKRDYVDLGGLVFYGTSTTDMWRRAATYVDKILNGGHQPQDR